MSERKKTLTDDFFLSAVILLLMHCGSVGTFSHSAPFISSPCSFFPCTATPSSTHTWTHPLLISKRAEPMKVNNCPLSWKCSLLLRWSEVCVCIQSKHHHSQIPTCGDLECSAARLLKTLALESGVCHREALWTTFEERLHSFNL